MKNNFGLVVLVLLALTAVSCQLADMLKGSSQSSRSSNVNFANTQPAKPNFKDFQAKAEELGKLSPPVKLEPKAKMKGKIAVVEKTNYGTFSVKGFHHEGVEYYEYDLNNYNLTKEQLALKTDEIDTLVQIGCDKGKAIGQYNVTGGRTIPAFALNCKVSMIDYKTPAVVAQKTFVSTKLEKDIKVYDSTKEYTAAIPYTEIEKYIKNFPRQ